MSLPTNHAERHVAGGISEFEEIADAAEALTTSPISPHGHSWDLSTGWSELHTMMTVPKFPSWETPAVPKYYASDVLI